MAGYVTRIILGLGLSAMTLVSFPNPARSQTYPIDCAILLCLSGGWPASVPCTQARAEFIRRITPWPVEPPLQIWRCPMGASFKTENTRELRARIYDVRYIKPSTLPRSLPGSLDPSEALPAVVRFIGSQSNAPSDGLTLHLAQDHADIDISGPEFNFVRSIRVFDVRYARQHEAGEDGDCRRNAYVVLGTYGTQGDFSWARSSVTALPDAHAGLERWGEDCPGVYHRSVFVDWRDYVGNYGFEQVDY